MAGKVNHPEDDLQKAVVQWLAIHEKTRGFVFYAVPNGGKRNVREAARFKVLGVRAGVPDLAIVAKNGRAFFIELKALKGRVTDKQKDMMQRLERAGAQCAVCYSLDDVRDSMRRWGVVP